MNKNYTITLEYEQIDIALKSFWRPFNDLLIEMDSFKFKPLSDFEIERFQLSAYFKKLNPDLSVEEINNIVEKRISPFASEDMQFNTRFSSRFKTINVTVTLLSQALCEAQINAILAAGLYDYGTPELFEDIQKESIKDKWVNGPKKFCPSYEFKKSSGLYETLQHLSRQRNAWIHHKSHLHAGGEKIIEGSNLKNLSYKEASRWIKRYFSLPYDLSAHVHEQNCQSMAAILVYNRNPIPVADAHR